MKQVLSVADFVTIINLLDKEIRSIENIVCDNAGEQLSSKDVQDALSVYHPYQNLIHLKESLQTLNIEVETPDIEISNEE